MLQVRPIEDVANRHRRKTLYALAEQAEKVLNTALVRAQARRAQSIAAMSTRTKSTLMGLAERGSGSLNDEDTTGLNSQASFR